MRFPILPCVFFLFPLQARPQDPELAQIFKKHRVRGCLVLASLDGPQQFIHNPPRSKRRYPCASTFKILNTLIALEENVISDSENTIKWDGKTHKIPEWNQDQNLENAFKYSCVWYYQRLAEKIHPDTYKIAIKNTGYGILKSPFHHTRFWLDGSLQISALEQIEFIKKLYLNQLPFKPSSFDVLDRIMIQDQFPSIKAKTGYYFSRNGSIGWYVGYIESPKGVWFFACNMDIKDAEKGLPLRQSLTVEALKAKGLI